MAGLLVMPPCLQPYPAFGSLIGTEEQEGPADQISYHLSYLKAVSPDGDAVQIVEDCESRLTAAQVDELLAGVERHLCC